MLKTLKRKFVIISLMLACLVLTSVVAVSIYSDIRSYNRSYEDALKRELNRSELDDVLHFFGPDKHDEDGNMNPEQMLSFSVEMGIGGKWTLISPFVSVDNDTLVILINAVAQRASSSGYLSEFGVVYEISGNRIAFVSVTNELAQLRKSIAVSAGAYLFAVLAFTVICTYLSRWALAPVERAWKQQQQFIADASHEIKTPLTVILANTDIMEKEQGANIWLTSTRVEAVHMKKLVENMLFLARSDAERPRVPSVSVIFSDIVWECSLAFEAVAYEKNIAIASNITPDCRVIGDSAMLHQLAAILLDNAVKYTPNGGHINVLLTIHKKDKLTFSVKNSGEEIKKEQLEHLFDRFYRSDTARARSEGGYGLGLSIAKEITERHKGSIHAESNEQLTTFTVILPLAQQ